MSRSSAGPATIIIDTREQEEYSFDPRLAATMRRALPAGDYSIAGLENTVAVERKALDDFVSTVIHCRERFRNELRKFAGYRAACVVVEAGVLDVLLHRYRGDAHPNAVLGSVLSIILDFRIPVFFCSNRQAACRLEQKNTGTRKSKMIDSALPSTAFGWASPR